jgi:hypothetical protein
MSNKANKQLPPITECEATLAAFEKQRAVLIQQHEQHTAKRREISFSAHAGDADASKLLDGLHDERV